MNISCEQLCLGFNEKTNLKPFIKLSKLNTELIKYHLKDISYTKEVSDLFSHIDKKGYVYDLLDIEFEGNSYAAHCFIDAYEPFSNNMKKFKSHAIFLDKYFRVDVDTSNFLDKK